MRKTFRAEFIRVFPDGRIAMREIDGIKQALAGRNAALFKFQVLRHAAVADMNGRIQTQAFLDHLVEKRRFIQTIHFLNHAVINMRMLSQESKCPCQQGGGGIVSGDEHGQHLVADHIVAESRVDQVLQ